MADVGTSTTIAFGTSGFTAEVMDVNGNDVSRADIDTTHMGSAGYREYMPSDLIEGGSVDFEFSFNPNQQPPIAAVPETITITFPTPTGGLTGATLVFSGYINTWSWGSPLEDKMTGSATIKVDGVTDPVWAAST